MDRVLLVDKPAGKTSHDVVAEIRRELGKGVKVGHAGTLDPFATGLLIVLVGRATRIQSHFMGLDKTYVVQARFGAVSTTGDRDGEITETGVLPERPLRLPTGRIMQRPPAFSAIKIGGQRAYKLARRGEEVEIPEREVTVYRFEDLGDNSFEIECSSGTYVRSLIADLGDAYCTELRRTAIGEFRVEDAPAEMGLTEAVQRLLPVLRVSGDDARRAGHGVAIPGTAEGRVALVDDEGVIALAEPAAGGLLKPVVGFRGA
jgi:tRNA pseudouridine55 synthase